MQQFFFNPNYKLKVNGHLVNGCMCDGSKLILGLFFVGFFFVLFLWGWGFVCVGWLCALCCFI